MLNLSHSAICNVIITLNVLNIIGMSVQHYLAMKRLRKIGKDALAMRDRCAQAVWHLLSANDKRKYKWGMNE